MTYPARAGDVYLICSDGLTTMVPEDASRRSCAAARRLQQAAEELVRVGERGRRPRQRHGRPVQARRGGRGRARTRPGDDGRRPDRVAAHRRRPGRRRGGRRARAGDGARRDDGLRRRADARSCASEAAARPPDRGARRTRLRRWVTAWPWSRWSLACRGSSASGSAAASSTSSAPTTAASSRCTAGCPTSCRSGSSCGSASTRPACRPGFLPESSRDRVLDHRLRSKGDADRPGQAGRARRAGGLMLPARWREFFSLIPVSLLVTAGFTAVLITRSDSTRRGHDDVRPLLPRLLRVRAPLHPRPAAGRRPLPVPAGGACSPRSGW